VVGWESEEWNFLPLTFSRSLSRAHPACTLPLSPVLSTSQALSTLPPHPSQVLGEMEVPTHVAAQGIVVEAATSYTSYRELWEDKLKLTQVCRGVCVWGGGVIE
jgi:hypothetical protein